ncbi:hypothetical protein Trydic_g18648 [Trypoxylus dichotomus]
MGLGSPCSPSSISGEFDLHWTPHRSRNDGSRKTRANIVFGSILEEGSVTSSIITSDISTLRGSGGSDRTTHRRPNNSNNTSDANRYR